MDLKSSIKVVTLTDFRLKCVIIITSKIEFLWKSYYCGYGKWKSFSLSYGSSQLGSDSSLAVIVHSLCRAKKISMTSNVLPIHFAPSQASSSQNSNVDSYLQYCEVDSLKQIQSESSLKMHHRIWEILSVLGADEYLERLEGKIRKFVFFHLKYSKITVPKSFHPTRENPRRDVLWLVQNCCWKGFFRHSKKHFVSGSWIMDIQ